MRQTCLQAQRFGITTAIGWADCIDRLITTGGWSKQSQVTGLIRDMRYCLRETQDRQEEDAWDEVRNSMFSVLQNTCRDIDAMAVKSTKDSEDTFIQNLKAEVKRIKAGRARRMDPGVIARTLSAEDMPISPEDSSDNPDEDEELSDERSPSWYPENK